MHAAKKWIMLSMVLALLSLSGGCAGEKKAAGEIRLEEVKQSGDTDEAEPADENRKTSAEGDETGTDRQADESGGKTDRDAGQGNCTVYVCGAVVSPGVYELPEGGRVYEALLAAGGTSPSADPVYLNQARELLDGEQIYVPTKEETAKMQEAGLLPGDSAGAGSTGADSAGTEKAADGKTSAKVNLNTATREELMTLSGIGQSKADSILLYRQEHGRFSSVEELMEIPGIKEGVFNKIRDSITVA